jgi:hypothetical protein
MIEGEKAVWRETTAALRPDWFQGAECLLGAYVGTVVVERDIGAKLAKYTPDSDRYFDLVRLRCLVASAMASLATKLQLTPQSTRDSRNVKLVSTLPKPWETPGLSDRRESPPRLLSRQGRPRDLLELGRAPTAFPLSSLVLFTRIVRAADIR